jgi:hypothetical protein
MPQLFFVQMVSGPERGREVGRKPGCGAVGPGSRAEAGLRAGPRGCGAGYKTLPGQAAFPGRGISGMLNPVFDIDLPLAYRYKLSF